MSTVYLVSNAEYYDGGTLAIFSTEQKAKEYCNLYNMADNKYLTAYIEKYDLDKSSMDNIGKWFYHIKIDYQFNVEKIDKVQLTTNNIFDHSASEETGSTYARKKNVLLLRILKEENDQLAIKIASDTVAQIKAQNTGVES